MDANRKFSPIGPEAQQHARRPPLRWTAFEVHDHYELVAAASIAAGGHEIYNPIEIQKFVRRGFITKIMRPFFQGYVFARLNIGNLHELSILLELKGIVDYVRVGAAIGLIPDRDINAVRRLENDRGEIPAAAATKFKAGDFVRVADGPFTSFSGRIGATGEEWVERDAGYGVKRLDLLQVAFVEIGLFGRSTPVKIYGDQLESA